MPGCHTHVRLIQYIVSLAHACSTIGSVCGTFIYNFISKRGYVKIVTCTTCHWWFLAYLKYCLVVGLSAWCVCQTSRNVLREQRFALLFAWCSFLGEASIHLHSIANDEALVVSIYSGTYPYNLRLESYIVLVQGVVLGGHFHSQLQSADVSFLAVVIYTIIISVALLVKLVGIALIVLVPDLLQWSCIIAWNPILGNKACIMSRRRTIIGFGACWSGSCAEIRWVV